MNSNLVSIRLLVLFDFLPFCMFFKFPQLLNKNIVFMICQKHPFWQQLNLTAFTWLDKSTMLFVIRVDAQQQQTTQIDFNYASINNIRSIIRFRKPDVVITKIYGTNKFDTNCNSIVGIYAPRPEFRLFVVECNRDNFEYIFRSNPQTCRCYIYMYLFLQKN